ncbi:DEAD/DEAH box helicase [Pseudomonas syringae]|uniref:Superfamily I DNA/RNA helicase n=3 Tax=Pseudomonas syringae TaxID=317 RepID=A0A656JJ51_PSESF|nr:AAA domain-containing protein [Pseudomonas syringae]EPN30456.1 superfamily I DNA/RNA helicase [Pseudomonas syringae pv. actinidiae ICMP 19096]EPM43022.1 superfamily I DNA/RNA helicase [Pseudomonas syringae pv. actinidiae ICMP 19098]EPM66172.1 superfamily I DNA/RNA helicase [Pseudomonas syringae pv. actinidiae ICMP 18804]EPN14330.1 superfamily I DNA/RNA helicase [Pseudomonas syringae pv. actinidiae ICMP 19100]EPN22396.1 superfamily I DNA/RNA helicase [Pseudomonas syringae pv. actinidiae ICMP
MTSKEPFDHSNLDTLPASLPASVDLIDHIDDWLEYLVKLVEMTDDQKTRKKYERQIKYLVRFRCGANCNVAHNIILAKYYLAPGDENATRDTSSGTSEKSQAALEIAEMGLSASMAILTTSPVQPCYLKDAYAYSQIQKALACEDIFFLQGPPGTGKTTAIVEIILQTLQSKPDARILITSETHVAVDNALDRLTEHLSDTELAMVMRYPRFMVATLENPKASEVQAFDRADAVWRQALTAAPLLTERLWHKLDRGRKKDDGSDDLPRWLVRNLADRHQIIGVTCNQIDHFMDKDSGMFDLAIVDECSKATMPEWLMALIVARKCVLVGDHKQLPPTFCQEESEALSELGGAQEKLIRDGVIERIFDNFPARMKGTLLKQYRMLPDIGTFISQHFYNNGLDHSRTQGNGLFEHFAWLTYDSRNYNVPPERGNDRKTLINNREIQIIVDRLALMHEQIREAKAAELGEGAFSTDEQREVFFDQKRRLSVAVITPYRAQCKQLRRALGSLDFAQHLTIEVDTVDAFQGRQADVVFFSFVRTVGPATFYADDRRMNVAISRARDCVYLVGSIDYIRSKRLPALTALAGRPVLSKAG